MTFLRIRLLYARILALPLSSFRACLLVSSSAVQSRAAKVRQNRVLGRSGRATALHSMRVLVLTPTQREIAAYQHFSASYRPLSLDCENFKMFNWNFFCPTHNSAAKSGYEWFSLEKNDKKDEFLETSFD